MKVVQSCPTLCKRLFVTPWTIESMEFSRPEYWCGEPFPFPEDLPNPGEVSGLPHCRRILYQLSQDGSPRVLEWVTYISSIKPGHRNQTSALQVDSLLTELSGKLKNTLLNNQWTNNKSQMKLENICI